MSYNFLSIICCYKKKKIVNTRNNLLFITQNILKKQFLFLNVCSRELKSIIPWLPLFCCLDLLISVSRLLENKSSYEYMLLKTNLLTANPMKYFWSWLSTGEPVHSKFASHDKYYPNLHFQHILSNYITHTAVLFNIKRTCKSYTKQVKPATMNEQLLIFFFNYS